jgi:hypothetical protein
MSRQNVEGVRAALALYQSPGGVARLASGELDLSLVTFDVEWDASRRDLDYDVEDVFAACDDVVALIRNQRQWGRSTGIVTELPPYSMVFSFRDGRVSRWRGYANQEDGLAAVGLKP